MGPEFGSKQLFASLKRSQYALELMAKALPSVAFMTNFGKGGRKSSAGKREEINDEFKMAVLWYHDQLDNRITWRQNRTFDLRGCAFMYALESPPGVF